MYCLVLTGVVLSNLHAVDLSSSRNLAIIGTSIFTGLMVPHWIESYPTELSTGKLLQPTHDKTNKMTVLPAKTQISLGTRPVWSESSLCAQWVVKDPSFLHADSEDYDQTGRMPRLI